jgi:parallel beta-helix repeat protein
MSPGRFQFPARTFEPLESRRLLAVYYVDINGSDSGDGSLAGPWRSLQWAALHVAAGDTVNVHAGDYNGFILGWDFPQSGAPGAPITFHADSGVTINARNPKTADGIDFEGSSYIVIDGFNIIPSATEDVWRAGIRAGGGGVGNVIRNNVVHLRSSDKYGIFSSFSQDLLVENNDVSGTDNSGIYTSNSAVNPTIRGNVVHSTGGNGLHFNGDISQGGSGLIDNALIENNIVYDVGTLVGGSAINMDGVQNSRIQNNLVYNAHAKGITLYHIDAADGSINNIVANNTVVLAPNATGYALSLKSGSSNNAVFNNILIGGLSGYTGAMNISWDSLPGLISDRNVVSDRISLDDGFSNISLAAWRAGNAQDQHSVVGDSAALFVNAAGNDYHLSATSTALNLGRNFADHPAPAFDLAGNVRPNGQNWDAGAYEFIGPLDTAPPVVSGVNITDINSIRATFSWTTDEPAAAWIEYGLDTSYGSSSPLDSRLLDDRTLTLRGLLPLTEYHARIVATDVAGNVGYSQDLVFTTLPPDLTPPVLSNIAVQIAAPVYGIIHWTTDEPASAIVDYGTTDSYGQSVSNSSLLLDHTFILSGLAPGTTYHFRVRSSDESLNESASQDLTFTTSLIGQIPPGLVGYWDFSESSGTTTADASGNGHTGSLHNGTAYVPGVSGNALNFDGYDDNVRIPRAPDLEPNQLTVAAWIKLAPETQQTWATIVKKDYAADTAPPFGTYSLAMSPDGLGNIVTFFTGHLNSTNQLNSPTPLPTGRWIFVAGTYDSTTGEKRLYVDDKLVASTVVLDPLAYDISQYGDLWLGQDPGNYEAFSGFIDKVGIWNRALNPSEIATLAYVRPVLSVEGGSGNDKFVLTYLSSTSLQIQVNSDPAQVVDTSLISEIQIDGLGGSDTIVINGSIGNDSVLFSARGMTFQTIATPITHKNVETVLFNSMGGVDSLVISSDAVLGLCGNATLSGLVMVPSAQLDLRSAVLTLEYSGGASPLADINALIASAHDGGKWDKPGISSSGATACTYSVAAFDDAAGLVTVKLVRCGDSNGDGAVDIIDLIAVATNWGRTGRNFSQGDFNYDGVVNSADLGLLSTNWQTGVAGAAMMATLLGLPLATTPASEEPPPAEPSSAPADQTQIPPATPAPADPAPVETVPAPAPSDAPVSTTPPSDPQPPAPADSSSESEIPVILPASPPASSTPSGKSRGQHECAGSSNQHRDRDDWRDDHRADHSTFSFCTKPIGDNRHSDPKPAQSAPAPSSCAKSSHNDKKRS